jgi:hypothetical protein
VNWRPPDPTPWWRLGPLRPAAEATVTAPDGREFVVRVRRVLWPGYTRSSGATRDFVKDGLTESVAGGVLDLFTSRFVWRVRVFGAKSRLGTRPLIYGEEWRERAACVQRAREIADELVAGRRP